MASETVVEPASGLAAYRRVFAAPHVRPLVGYALLARMPIGMGAVALILFIHGQTDSFGAAGVVAGAYTIASTGSAARKSSTRVQASLEASANSSCLRSKNECGAPG